MSAVRQTLRRHPRHVVLFALAAGMAAAVWAPPAVILLAPAAAAAGGRRAAGAWAVVAVLGGACLADARRDAVDGGRLPARIGERLDGEVVLLEPLRHRPSGERVARAAWREGDGTVLLRVPPAAGRVDPEVGGVVTVSGRLAQLRPFDAFQRRRGALAALDVHELSVTAARRGGVPGLLDGVRRRAEAALGAGLPPDRAALVHGMVLGRDDRVGPAPRAAFEDSGLAHLLAASGSNVMLLATLVLGAGALAGAPLRWRLGMAIVLIAVYVPVAGGGPSIQRAGVMGAAGLVAALAGRPASRWYAVGLAAAVTQAVNPYAAGEPGWQLSFAAVAGLIACARPLRTRLTGLGVPAPAAEVAALTLAATVATAPLMALHFGRLSTVAVVANLAAAPAVAPVMWVGTVAALLGQVGIVTPLSGLAGLGAAYVAWVAETTAAVPGASLELRAGPAGVASACGVAALAWRAWRRLRRLPRSGLRAGTAAAAAIAAAVALVAALTFGAGPEHAPPAPGETLVSFLDVGQGDATLLQRDGAAVLFDTGPPDGPVLRQLAEAGVRRLDALVITHAQADHEGAALDVVREMRPRLVINGGTGWPTPVQRELSAAAAAAGSRVALAAAGDVVHTGELELRFLWPPRELLLAPPEGDPNGRALVAHARAGGFDLLLPADAESDVTSTLRLPRVEALKVSHHGSDDALLPEVLERTRPTVAAIEVGRDNAYGHPTPATLAALRAVPELRRTDRDGTIRLWAAADGGLRLTPPARGRRAD